MASNAVVWYHRIMLSWDDFQHFIKIKHEQIYFKSDFKTSQIAKLQGIIYLKKSALSSGYPNDDDDADNDNDVGYVKIRLIIFATKLF